MNGAQVVTDGLIGEQGVEAYVFTKVATSSRLLYHFDSIRKSVN